MALVKICGLREAKAFEAAFDAGADYLGFVFFMRSPRYISPGDAVALSARRPIGPPRVGLFVNEDDVEIAGILARIKLDILQVHNTVERARGLRARFGLPVWRAVPVSTATDLPDSLGGSDALLLDAKAPAGATRPGGNARSFDWSLLTGWSAPGPWILAGGLTPENVAGAIAISGARVVDVSSGVESAPGVKNPDRIRAFIAAAR